MADIRDKLLRGSYNGINFYFREATYNGGIKTAEHVYPNSDNVVIEQMGRMPKKYAMIIAFGLNDYFDERDSLIRELETEGAGTLIHPTFGELTVKVSGEISFTENVDELGISYINVTFVEERGIIELTDTGANVGVIGLEKESLFDLTAVQIAQNFSISNSLDVINGAKNKLTDSVSGVMAIANNVRGNTDTATTVFSTINNFLGSITSYLSDPVGLASGFSNMFMSLNTLLDSSSARAFFDSSKDQLFNFGEKDPTLKIYNVNDRVEANNNKVINQAVQVNAVAQAMDAVTYIEFNNDQDLADVKQIINDKFSTMMADDSLPKDVRSALISQRQHVLNYMDSLKVSSIRDVDVPVATPSQLLSYQYYNETDSAEDIISLNRNKASESLQGQVKILVNDYE